MAAAGEVVMLETIANDDKEGSPEMSRTIARLDTIESDRGSTVARLDAIDSDGGVDAQTLPPMDGGSAAWRFLAGAVVLEMFTWGFSLSYGIFFDYFSAPGGPFDSSSPAALASIGTIAVALQYGLLLPLSFVYRRFPYAMRTITWVGLIVTFAALFLSSFAQSLWQLVLLQGVLYGAASSAMYAPVISYLNEWFAARRGFATGCVFAGTLPLILGRLVLVDWRWAIRAYAIASTIVCGLAITQVKARLPLPPRGRPRPARPLPIAWLRQPLFYPVLFTVFVQSVGLLTVSLYIPTFSTVLGLSFFTGQLALASFNLAGVFGRVAIGFCVDRYSYLLLMFASAALSAIVSLTLWAFVSTLGLLLAFSIVFGVCSNGFTSAWSTAAADIGGKNDRQQQTVIFGVFSLAKGTASVVGPLIGGSLRGDQTTISSYGNFGFEPVVIFVGSAMAATCAGTVVSALIRRRRVV